MLPDPGLPTRRFRLVPAVAALAAVVLVGGFLSFAVATVGAMSSDPCSTHDDEGLICTSWGLQLLFLVPFGGWLVAVAVSVVGVVRLVRRGQGPWRLLACGVGILLTAIAVAVWIAEQPVGG